MSSLLHSGEASTPDVGAGRIGLAVDHDHAELSKNCWFGVLMGGLMTK